MWIFFFSKYLVNYTDIKVQDFFLFKGNKNQQKVSNSRTLANWKPEIKTNDYCLFKIMINNC